MADISHEYNPPVRFNNLRAEMDRFFAQVRNDLKRDARRQRVRRMRVLCARYLGGKAVSTRILDFAFILFFGACAGLIVIGILDIAVTL